MTVQEERVHFSASITVQRSKVMFTLPSCRMKTAFKTFVYTAISMCVLDHYTTENHDHSDTLGMHTQM